MPAVVADAQLLPRQVAVAATRAATVVAAVRDVAGLSLPVLLALAVDAARRRVGRAAPAVARAVVGAGVHPGGGAGGREEDAVNTVTLYYFEQKNVMMMEYGSVFCAEPLETHQQLCSS